MKETIYIKKEIKTEDDLPKDFSQYNWHSRNDLTLIKLTYILSEVQNKNWWIDTFDWYLQEVQLPTDEEIEKEILQIKRKESLSTVDYYSTGFNAGIKWMRNKLLNK